MIKKPDRGVFLYFYYYMDLVAIKRMPVLQTSSRMVSPTLMGAWIVIEFNSRIASNISERGIGFSDLTGHLSYAPPSIFTVVVIVLLESVTSE